MSDNKQMTVTEALAAGYEYCLYHEDGYQSLISLSDPQGIQFSRNPVLVEQEGQAVSVPVSEDLAELLAEHIECNWSDETSDDTMEVYDIVKQMDFTDVHERIAKALEAKRYYRGTDIKLIPHF